MSRTARDADLSPISGHFETEVGRLSCCLIWPLFDELARGQVAERTVRTMMVVVMQPCLQLDIQELVTQASVEQLDQPFVCSNTAWRSRSIGVQPTSGRPMSLARLYDVTSTGPCAAE